MAFTKLHASGIVSAHPYSKKAQGIRDIANESFDFVIKLIIGKHFLLLPALPSLSCACTSKINVDKSASICKRVVKNRALGLFFFPSPHTIPIRITLLPGGELYGKQSKLLFWTALEN